ncbi:MAG: squalene synthase HpnC [Bacteroidetes bacterium]|nr:squalene synthase HpnC [Bacteroidota bacterium]
MIYTTVEAFDFCQRLARKHYENFPVASMLLPRNIRKHVAAIYAFARIADDSADEGTYTPEERLSKLDEWERQLHDCYRGVASHPVFIALRETVSQFALPIEYFMQLLTAFRTDVCTNRYGTWNEVLEYCKNSANPVGRIMLHLFGYTDPERTMLSDAICTGLQLTNFWQDLSVDVKKNRLYVPLEECQRYNCSAEDFLSLQFSPNVSKVVKEMVDRTEQFFQRGTKLVSIVRFPLNYELKLTLLGGSEILALIRKQQYNTFVKRPALGVKSGVALLFRSFFIKL